MRIYDAFANIYPKFVILILQKIGPGSQQAAAAHQE
jgi:hypothetical protein